MENYNKTNGALTTAPQVEQLADHLSLTADAMHRRLLKLMRNDGAISEREAQTLFEAEVALRQQANTLYADAMHYILTGLDLTQESVMALVTAAQQRIDRIERAQALIDLGIDVLTLTTAILSSKPEAILNGLKKMREQLASLQQEQATPAA